MMGRSGFKSGCDMNCILNFTKHERVAILRKFANKSKDEIDNHLYSLIEKREKPKFTYHALKGEERHVVCRKAFISLHNTSTKAVYRLTKLLEKDQVPEDFRGKHGHQRSPRPQWVNDMMHHHMLYCVSLQDIGRHDFTDDAGVLVVNRMYQLFVDMSPWMEYDVSYYVYLRYFKRHFGGHYSTLDV
ncbi:unnamed protein product [Timema podura]|uniref:Transposase n=1 Tax=Timema podura TaxID=61482 RepID=A0ABN7PAM1_TIMPD|nr:unnamed protein product [Timema podura]